MTTNPYESPEQKSNSLRSSGNWLGSAARIGLLIGSVGFLLLLVMPRWPMGVGREGAREAQCCNNLRNIALALQQYESVYHGLPPAYTVDPSGKPLHSWRTLILPFLEQKALYDQIDLTKAWDDPTNQHVHQTVVRVFECPSRTGERAMTTYFAVMAPGGCFKATESAKLADVKDRPDLTLMVIEVPEKHAAHWMSPVDASEEMMSLLDRKVGDFSHPSGPHAAFVDGHFAQLMIETPADVIRALISIAGNDDQLAQQY